jgi:uncharacterized protein (TIGR02118 family)
MTQMIVIYNVPKNPAAFDRHHFEVHVPLARKLPGGSLLALLLWLYRTYARPSNFQVRA